MVLLSKTPLKVSTKTCSVKEKRVSLEADTIKFFISFIIPIYSYDQSKTQEVLYLEQSSNQRFSSDESRGSSFILRGHRQDRCIIE